MIKINNIDPANTYTSALQYRIQDLIFTTTGITIFMVYIISNKYKYTTLFTTENNTDNYPINMYNNQRILNNITKPSNITIGESGDDMYVTLYTVSINILSGSAYWYEAIYNKTNKRKSHSIIFPNVTSFN
jgi:hypothetical protein